MATHTVNNQRLLLQQLKKTKTSPRPISDLKGEIPTTIHAPTPTPPSSAKNSSSTLVTRTELAPSSRIVVVRTTNITQDDKGDSHKPNETEKSKSVELPPLLTNGRTSVYLIRRPIPPNESPIETQFYQSDFNDANVTRTVTTTTTTTTAPKRTTTTTGAHSSNLRGFRDNRTPSPPEDIAISPDPREQQQQQRAKPTTKRRPFFSRSNSPEVESIGNENINESFSRSPTINNYESSTQQLVSSPTQDSFQTTTRRSRSGSKSRKRDLSRSISRRRARSTADRPTPSKQPPPPPPLPPPTTTIEQYETKDLNRKPSFLSFSQTKSTGVQANLPPQEPVHVEQRAIQTARPILTKKTLQKKSQVKPAKAIVLVNPEDQTVAVIENPYLSGRTIKPVVKAQQQQSKSLKQTRFEDNVKYNQFDEEEKIIETSRWYRCVGCCSRHMCLILTICLLFFFIGLAGVGVSAYFYATDSQSNTIPKIVGIAVGGALAIISLLILYCILACIGSRDGYFTYNDASSHTGGQAYALIPPTHPNAHNYIPCDFSDVEKKKSLVSVTSYGTSPQPLLSSSVTRSASTHRQKTLVAELASTASAKNVTIEMPERLLTGRQMSPKTHERKINKVVNNIGQVVDETKKRYNGDMPTKVIVKIDDTNEKIQTKK